MSRDASLDEFLGTSAVDSEGSDAEDAESGDGEESVESEVGELAVGESAAEDGDDDGNASGVSPASTTYLWTPTGDACARCSDSVDRLWRCEGELVCGECKEW